jgi:hypothetical protein
MYGSFIAVRAGNAYDIIALKNPEGYLHREMGQTEADARAKMLLYLLENKLSNATLSAAAG